MYLLVPFAAAGVVGVVVCAVRIAKDIWKKFFRKGKSGKKETPVTEEDLQRKKQEAKEQIMKKAMLDEEDSQREHEELMERKKKMKNAE